MSEVFDDRSKTAVASLVEDAKMRWQELVTLENELNRWRSLYLSAIVAVLAWWAQRAEAGFPSPHTYDLRPVGADAR